jgi:uncharacterized protein (TIGR00730 family)
MHDDGMNRDKTNKKSKDKSKFVSLFEDRKFIEGPHSRLQELWFMIRVVTEFLRGFRKLHFIGPCVTVFGSARFDENHHYYKLARHLGNKLAKLGLTIMTGGGPGIMEAANRGAREAGGRSVGCNITLPIEQNQNPYLDSFVTFDYFFVRKVLLFKYSYAFVVLPGGVGTMDEFFEAITLIQTNKILSFPVVLIGREYFEPLMGFLKTMIEEGTISENDLELMLLTDSVEEAISHIQKHAVDKFSLDLRRIPTPSKLLGEENPSS